MGSVLAPHDILYRGCIKLGDDFLLLDVVKDHRTRGADDEASCAAVEDLVRLNRRLDALDNSASQIANFDKLPKNNLKLDSPLERVASVPELSCLEQQTYYGQQIWHSALGRVSHQSRSPSTLQKYP